MRAECQRGHLSLELAGPTPAVVACHCTACQRRSGPPFGVLAYYPGDRLIIAGEVKRLERLNEEGNASGRSSARRAVQPSLRERASTHQ